MLEDDIGKEEWEVKDKLLKADAAAWWLERGVDRKVVKTPVMTYGYSSRLPGFTEKYEDAYVLPAFNKEGRKGSNPMARYLAKHTLNAVEAQLPAVARGMQWLMDVADVLAHEGKPVSWVTPSGFPVSQAYPEVEIKRINSVVGGEKLRLSTVRSKDTVAKKKQKSSIAPNFIHSMDAAHLVLTVLKAQGYDVTNFALIHDSFGTTASDTDAMFCAVRQAFVEMYDACSPFEDLYEHAYGALSEEGREKLPLPPGQGDLALEGVLDSLYAFA